MHYHYVLLFVEIRILATMPKHYVLVFFVENDNITIYYF